MDKTIHYKNMLKKVIVYTSTAMIATTAPALQVHAAETDQQTTDIPAETPAQQQSQPASNTAPTEVPGNTPIPDTPADAAPATPQAPADAAATTPQAPADTTTITPQPEPVDQGTFNVTPMQGTVYAASPKGLNVRSGPSTNHGKLGTLKYGQEITVTGTTADNWYQIQYSGGVGYVLADFVSTTPPASSQSPDAENPDANAAENPPAENDDAIAAENPPAEIPVTEPASEIQSEDSSAEEGNPEEASRLLGTPVVVALAVAIVAVIALICYSVYSLFKKEPDITENFYEDEDDEDDPYSGDEYYEDEQYSDDEYYEDEQYPDDEYYGDEPYAEDEYHEDGQYSDDEYHEDIDKK